MTIAFGKLLHCVVLIRACLFARGRFIYYWMKRLYWLYSMWEMSFPLVLLVYLFLSLSIHRSILRSCDRKLFFASDVAVVDVIVTRKRELLCFGGLGNFPQKIFSQTNYLYINKSLQEICCSLFEVLSINESFQLNYSPFNSTQSKNSHNNWAFLSPFSRKKSITIFAKFRLRASIVTQRPIINLKKKHPR